MCSVNTLMPSDFAIPGKKVRASNNANMIGRKGLSPSFRYSVLNNFTTLVPSAGGRLGYSLFLSIALFGYFKGRLFEGGSSIEAEGRILGKKKRYMMPNVDHVSLYDRAKL